MREWVWICHHIYSPCSSAIVRYNCRKFMCMIICPSWVTTTICWLCVGVCVRVCLYVCLECIVGCWQKGKWILYQILCVCVRTLLSHLIRCWNSLPQLCLSLLFHPCPSHLAFRPSSWHGCEPTCVYLSPGSYGTSCWQCCPLLPAGRSWWQSGPASWTR